MGDSKGWNFCGGLLVLGHVISLTDSSDVCFGTFNQKNLLKEGISRFEVINEILSSD